MKTWRLQDAPSLRGLGDEEARTEHLKCTMNRRGSKSTSNERQRLPHSTATGHQSQKRQQGGKGPGWFWG